MGQVEERRKGIVEGRKKQQVYTPSGRPDQENPLNRGKSKEMPRKILDMCQKMREKILLLYIYYIRLLHITNSITKDNSMDTKQIKTS